MDMDSRLLDTNYNAYDGSCATYVQLSDYKNESKSDFDKKVEKTRSPSKDLKFIIYYLVIKPFFNPVVCKPAVALEDRRTSSVSIRLYLLLVLMFGVGTECTASLIMRTNGDFYRSITSHDKTLFCSNLLLALSVVVLVAIQKACKLVCKEMLALHWRNHLVKVQTDNYFSRESYYFGLNCIDTQDQRISQDTDRLASALSELYCGSIVLPGVVIYYTVCLVYLFNWIIPVACFVFFLVGSFLNYLCVKRVVPYVAQQEKYEGLFRFSLFWIQKYAETIVLTNKPKNHKKGTIDDKVRVLESFENVIKNRKRIVCKHLPMYLSSQLFDYLGTIVSYAALGLFILYTTSGRNGDASVVAAQVSKGTFAVLYLINAFTSLFDLSGYASEVAAYARRVKPMLLMPAKERDQEEPGNDRVGEDALNANCLVRLVDVTIGLSAASQDTFGSTKVFQAKALAKNVNVHVTKGTNVIVTGPSGCGKSSLVKVISNIWKPRVGKIYRDPSLFSSIVGQNNRKVGLYVAPQEPYIYEGSFESLLFYNFENEAVDQQRLAHVLELLELHQLLQRCGGMWKKSHDWPNELSRGEKQRISLARLFLEKPTLAILDEATSAIDIKMCKKIYNQLKADKITVVTVGHYIEHLKAFHDVQWEFKCSSDGDAARGRCSVVVEKMLQ